MPARSASFQNRVGNAQCCSIIESDYFNNLFPFTLHKAALKIHPGNIEQHVEANTVVVNDSEHFVHALRICKITCFGCDCDAVLSFQSALKTEQAVCIDVG